MSNSNFFTVDRDRVDRELTRAQQDYNRLIAEIEVKLIDLRGEAINQINQLKTGQLPISLGAKVEQINRASAQAEKVKQQIETLLYLLGET